MLKKSTPQKIKTDIDNIVKICLSLQNAIGNLLEEEVIKDMYFNELHKLDDKAMGILNDLHPIIGYSVVLDIENSYKHECK